MAPSRALPAATTAKIPLFLAPAFAESTAANCSAIRSFSSTACNLKNGKGKDKNKRRGVSAMRSTGFSRELNVEKYYKKGLPTPRPEHERPLENFPTNPNHGLYGFFTAKKETVLPGEKEEEHGRHWTRAELMFKSFDDLHTIYWQCILEQNRVATRQLEHKRLRLGYGQPEIEFRLKTVQRSMDMIRKVLRDRQTAYEHAQILRETKTIQELLTEPEREDTAIYTTPEPETPLSTEAPTEAPSPTSASASPSEQPIPDERISPEERRRSLLGPRPED